MLRCLGIRLKGKTWLPGDNLGMLQSSTIAASELKKKPQAVSFHMVRECTAANIVVPIKCDTLVNIADFLTKSLEWKSLHFHSGAFFGRWDTGTLVDMRTISL